METVFKVLLLAFSVTLFGCGSNFSELPAHKVLLFKDKFGIYSYDPTSKQDKKIYKATANEIFLREPVKVFGDTLVFAVKGELKVSTQNNGVERYTKKFFSLNLSNGQAFLSKTVDYFIESGKMKIQTTSFTPSGSVLSRADSFTTWRGGSYSSTSVEYNEEAERYFSQSVIVKEQSAFSRSGNIYYAKSSDTSLLVEYTGNFDPKFGSGYYQPQISHSGDFLLFRYLPGFQLINLTDKPALYKIDLPSKRKEKIKKGVFANPVLSTDDKFVLYARDQRQGERDTWISDIYIMELKTLKEQHIGNASFAYWLD